jgi:trimeric autotransporter adhesin
MKRVLLIAAFLFSLCVPASSQFNGCSAGFCAPVSSGGVTPATLTFEAFSTNTSASPASFTSVNFGTTSSKRVIAFVAVARAAGAPTAATICGNVATLLSGTAAIDSTNEVTSAIFYFADAGSCGTSGTVTVTYSGGVVRSGIYVYSILTSTPTPASGNSVSSTSAVTGLTASLTVPSSGVGFVGIVNQQTGNTQSFTNASLDSSNALSGATNSSAAGHTTSTGSVSITGTSSGTANNMTMSMAAWGP